MTLKDSLQHPAEKRGTQINYRGTTSVLYHLSPVSISQSLKLKTGKESNTPSPTLTCIITGNSQIRRRDSNKFLWFPVLRQDLPSSRPFAMNHAVSKTNKRKVNDEHRLFQRVKFRKASWIWYLRFKNKYVLRMMISSDLFPSSTNSLPFL